MELSVVVPILNEAKNLQVLHERLSKALSSLTNSYEIITIDDGSTDNSFSILREIQLRDPHLRIIKLRRNFGQHPATFAGFENAKGGIVISIDADLQNDPSDIPKLLRKLNEGFDVVSGKRLDRTDSLFRRKIPSLLINRFVSVRTGLVQTDTGCFLKAYTNKAAKEIAKYTEPGGFFTASIGLLGFKYAEVEVSHGKRQAGQSHYDFFVQLNQFMSLFTGYARRPFQVIEVIGALTVLLSVVILGGNLSGIFGKITITSLLLTLMIGVAGLILGCLGIIGEYIIRIYHSNMQKPRYLIEDIYEP